MTRPTTPSASVVLLYHRVGRAAVDPWGLTVTPEHFVEQMDAVARWRPTTLDTLISSRDAGHVAVTFDDGYAETMDIALPQLRARGIPATVYIPSGSLGAPREFWWDELAALLFADTALPRHFEAEVGDGSVRVDLAEDARARDPRAHEGWRAWHDAHPTRRHLLYRLLWERIHPLPPTRRSGALQAIRDWSGITGEARPDYRCMTQAEARRLGADDLCTLGAHTVTHASLASLPKGEQQQEIAESARAIRTLTGSAPPGFAYPYGKPEDVSAETVQLVRASGLSHACMNVPGTVMATTDAYRIPRLFVEDMAGAELASWLEATMCR